MDARNDHDPVTIASSRLWHAEAPGAIVGALRDSLADLGVVHCSIRAGTDPQAPSLLASTMSAAWVSYYRDQGYGAVDPGPRHAIEAARPRAMSFDPAHPSYGWTGALHDMARDLRELDVQASAIIPLAPFPGERFCVVSYYTCETATQFDAWLARARPILEKAAALAHYRALGLRDRTMCGDEVPLTAREAEVLTGLAQGQRPDRIAGRLGISDRTVEFHLANARRKLGARTREQAVAVAVARGAIRL